ncbi:MAG: hypothetical protein KAT04_06270 [Methylococcales bacterium]|nr:hypothetical protein [Methylococcales bacterium]
MLKKFILAFLVLSSAFVLADSKVKDEDIFTPNQTSASLLVNYAEKLRQQAKPENIAEAEKKYLLIYDIYIKARSYALLNKVFFWLSLVFGLAVLLWPSFSIIFKTNTSKWEWIKSATVQTTVTGLAALMFAFYSQYKDKQTYAETLMRYAIYSEVSVSELSIKVSEELAKIDRGFSFNSILTEKKHE